MVPVIVNAILNEHQIIVDIVAFVNKGDFPRSRLGEKQRGKLLAGWVTRKMRTLAQFAIRDLDPATMGEGADAMNARRVSMLSAHSGGGPHPASLRNMEQAPKIVEQEEYDQKIPPASLHVGIPTEQATAIGYPPPDLNEAPDTAPMSPGSLANTQHGFHGEGGFDFGDAAHAATPDHTAPPAPNQEARASLGQVPPQIRLPGVDGRESVDFWNEPQQLDRNSWEQDAIMHMNLAGEMNQPK